MRVHALQPRGIAALGHQVLLHAQFHFAADPERCDQQQIERAPDRALGGIFDRHHRELRIARLAAAEHLVDQGPRQRLHATAEMAAHRLLAERALRPQVGDADRLLEATARGDDFAEHARQRLGAQRVAAARRDTAQDLRFALRTVGRRIALQAADALREPRAPLQQLDELAVERVDLGTQLIDVPAHGSSGRYLTASTPSMARSAASAAAGTGLSTSTRV